MIANTAMIVKFLFFHYIVSSYNSIYYAAISNTIRGSCSNQVIFGSQNTTKTNIKMTHTRETTIDSRISKKSELENRGILFFNQRMNGSLYYHLTYENTNVL